LQTSWRSTKEDPRALAKWAKKVGETLGDEVGEELDEMTEKVIEAGTKKEEANE
jgi:hypothetical protein